MLNFLQTCIMSRPHRLSPCHQQSFLFLLSLIVTPAICCFLCRWGRSIANEVCGATVLLADSSKVVNFLLKVVWCFDYPPWPSHGGISPHALYMGRMMGLKVELPGSVHELLVDRDVKATILSFS